MSAKRILLVDDDHELVEALTLALESAGYEVITASNGSEAWDRAAERRPDLAIIDTMMDTVIDGIQLTHRFRRDQDQKNVPIIMLTGINQRLGLGIDRETEEGYLPVDKFLEKPVEPNVLLREVAELLGRR